MRMLIVLLKQLKPRTKARAIEDPNMIARFEAKVRAIAKCQCQDPCFREGATLMNEFGSLKIF